MHPDSQLFLALFAFLIAGTAAAQPLASGEIVVTNEVPRSVAITPAGQVLVVIAQ